MKNIGELKLGFSDAQNYSQRAYKTMFNEVFVKNQFLSNLLEDTKYFLIGEKGTGKTAYAVYLSNSEQDMHKSFLKYISGTDYEKFYALKKQKQLELSDYSSIWKTILLLLLSKSVSDNKDYISKTSKSTITELVNAIDEYYQNAFSPEILTALKLIEQTDILAKIVGGLSFLNGNVGLKKNNQSELSHTKFQTNLMYIEKSFLDSFSKLKLEKNIILFIDGIDVRPDGMPYPDYIECIRGLTNAAWLLNTDFFQQIKDSKGHIRIVLLLRPDIYSSLNLQNATNKLLDNSVFLDWRTTYNEYRRSHLYKMATKLISYDQMVDESEESDLWDSYFPWKLISTNENRTHDTPFIAFLRICLSRPRDIQVILLLLQSKMVKDGDSSSKTFLRKTFESDEFQNNYSEYFMSSLKDQLSFYYDMKEFGILNEFFKCFDKLDFTYHEFSDNYNKIVDYTCKISNTIPEFLDDPKKLLQMLYDCNVIAAIDKSGGSQFISFSYREKTSSNINPKVPFDENNVSYKFHNGMYKKIKFGKF